MIVEEVGEKDVYTKVEKETPGKKDKKKITKKAFSSKPNKPQTRLGLKKAWNKETRRKRNFIFFKLNRWNEQQ